MRAFIALFIFSVQAIVATSVQATPIAFDEALLRIVSRDTQVGAQRSNADATRARNIPIRLAFAPSITGDASQTTTKTESAPRATARSLQAVARLNLFRFGADLANWRAASSDETAADAAVAASVLKAEDSGTRLLIAELQRNMEIEVNARIARSRGELLAIARERYARGLLPAQETQKFEIDLANVQASLRDAELQRYETHSSLAQALGERTSDDALVPLEWPWKERLTASPARALAADPLKLDSVPTWRAAQARAEAESERQSRNLRAIFPSIDGSLSVGRTYLGGTSTDGWTGVVNVSIPLFERLTNYSNYRAQYFARQNADLALEQAERDVRAEFDASRRSFTTALESALARERTVELSRRIYRDSLRRFQAGRLNANDLVVDQSRTFDSERLAIQGWGAAHLAYMRLCHALGRSIFECK